MNELMSLENISLAELDYIGENEDPYLNDVFRTARAAHHWKANHDNIVARLRLFTQRGDLPVDRIPAYHELVRLQEENEKLRARNLEWEEKYDHENPQGLIQYALTEAHHDEHHQEEARLKAELLEVLSLREDNKKFLALSQTAQSQSERLLKENEKLRVARAAERERITNAFSDLKKEYTDDNTIRQSDWTIGLLWGIGKCEDVIKAMGDAE